MSDNEELASEPGADVAGISGRHRWGWYLFDFANSVLIINGGLYFPQWIVVDNHVSDFWFNFIIVLSSLLLLVTGPILGILSDRRVKGISFLRYTSAAMFLAGVGIGVGGRIIEERTLRVGLALACFFGIMYCYQLSLVFYNVMLADISRPDRYARISGKGYAWGWIGGILGIFFIMPFVEGKVPFFQPAGRIQAILPSTIVFGILTAISLHMLRDIRFVPSKTQREPLGALVRGFLRDIRETLRSHNLCYFLLSYLLFSDAVLTLQNNSTIYMEKVLSFSDNMKAYQFLLVLVTGVIGGIASGYIAERFGLKRTLVGVLIGWIVTVSCLGLITNGAVFTVFFGLLGFLNGAVWNVSRVMFMLLIPEQKRGEYFGIYSSYERFASVIGPLVWSAPIVLLPSLGAVRYQVAWLTMVPLLLVSISFLTKVQTDDRATSLA